MVWNPKAELVKKATEIAKEKYPKGFNKKQLVECSKEVNGGFSTNKFKSIKTMEDVNHMRNHMANIDGNYPASISGCYVVGINGGCGLECPVFQAGDCEELGSLLEDLEEYEEFDDEEKASIRELYKEQP